MRKKLEITGSQLQWNNKIMQLSKEVRTKICQVVKKMLNVLNYYIPVLGCHQKINGGFTGIVQFFLDQNIF